MTLSSTHAASTQSAIVITGAGSGIGRAAAHAAADLGAPLVLVGRRRAPLERTALGLPAGTPADVVVADLSEPEGAEALASHLDSTAVRGLALVAGGLGADSTEAGLAGVAQTWIDAYRQNVLTAVLTVEAVKQLLTNHARIVAIGSIAGTAGGGSYGAAKASLTPWIRDLARTLGPLGVTANVVAPGFTEGTEFFGGSMSPARRERLIDATSTRRAATPEDIAATIAFLLSSAAGHITGQVIHVNGGALMAG